MRFPYLRDYDSRYRRTYVSIKEDGVLTPYLVEEIVGNDRDPKFYGRKVHSSGNLDVDKKCISFLDEDLVLNVPKLGMVGNEGTLSYLARKPLQRWKQGFDFNSLRIRDYVRSPNRSINIWSVFNPSDTPLENAVRLTENSLRGIRLHRYAGIVGTGKDKRTVVYRAREVGTYDNGTLIIPSTFESIQDSLKRTGFDDIELFEVLTEEQALTEVRNDKYNKDNVRHVPRPRYKAQRVAQVLERFSPETLAYEEDPSKLYRALEDLYNFVYNCRVNNTWNYEDHWIKFRETGAGCGVEYDDGTTKGYWWRDVLNLVIGAMYNPHKSTACKSRLNKIRRILPAIIDVEMYIPAETELNKELEAVGYREDGIRTGNTGLNMPYPGAFQRLAGRIDPDEEDEDDEDDEDW